MLKNNKKTNTKILDNIPNTIGWGKHPKCANFNLIILKPQGWSQYFKNGPFQSKYPYHASIDVCPWGSDPFNMISISKMSKLVPRGGEGGGRNLLKLINGGGAKS